MNEALFGRDALQIERDARAERRRRAEIAVEDEAQRIAGDVLVDGAENRLAVRCRTFRCARGRRISGRAFAALPRSIVSQRAALGDAAGAARRILVGDRAGTDDRAGAQDTASSPHARSAAANENVMSSPALGAPNRAPFRCTASGRCTLPSVHASPSSSGVTATGEKAVAGFDWKKPKLLASSAGMRLRSLRRSRASAA